MADVIYVGAPPIPVKLRVSARARRYSLRVSNVDGSVNLTLPKRHDMREATAFAESYEGWIRKHQARHVPRSRVAFGNTVLFEGRSLPVVQGYGRIVQVSDQSLAVPGPPEKAGARVLGFLKAEARVRLGASSAHYADLLGARFTGITIRDTRSRWGSCSTTGRLNYSWRLIMAPKEVLDYVAAHEVCHLNEMNHSPAYWRLVAQICPGYEEPRRWLKKHGSILHSYEFS